MPWRTLAGLVSEPGTFSRIGPVTAEVTRALAAAAVSERDCQWRVIVVGRAGAALGVASVPRTWASHVHAAGPALDQPTVGSGGLMARVTLTIPLALVEEARTVAQAEWACQPGLRPVLAAALRAAVRAARGIRVAAPAHDPCSHREEVPGYRIPDSLRALVESRDQTCRFPGCRQPAWRCDQDHTRAYGKGGRTCSCNLSPACRRHHRLKQRLDWLLTQPRPGVLTWHTPAGLSYTVMPEPYAC